MVLLMFMLMMVGPRPTNLQQIISNRLLLHDRSDLEPCAQI